MKSLLNLTALFVSLSLFVSCQAGQSNAEKTKHTEKQPAAALAENSSTTSDAAKASSSIPNKIIVYYFRGGARCPTCFKLENFAKSEIESTFSEAIKSGVLEFKSINVEEKGNEHFGTDYKLYTKSVIVSTIRDGKELSWKNLDQIWQLVHEEEKYRTYIKNEVKACLEGKCL